jgi:hypothetical protein
VRFSNAFEIGANTESAVTVLPSSGPVNGVGAHDMFILESIDAAGHSMFAPGVAASAAVAPGG